ncbi:hypothetical protein KKD37_04585 [Patescibacteria group bacterium]|nr:hypothetical protein [Patescibacteria group bacterium]
MNRLNTSVFESNSKNNNLFVSRTNMKNYNVTEIKNLVDTAKSALIVVPTLSVDSVGAALALAISLKKQGKEARVFCPQKTDQNYSKLSGLELLTDTYSSSDLVVTLDYPIDQIEAVSYNDDGGHLNLVVKTKSGAAKVETKQIMINNNGSSADVCFMLGDESPLGAAISMVEKGNWILITPQQVSKSWAKATLMDPDAPFSEIFTFLLPMLGLTLDLDSGKDLLIGLRVATQSFSVNVSPETFEAGAICLRATQPDDSTPQNPEPTPIENVEKSAGLAPGTNKPNPTPMA